jgi:hypothetical protein
VLHGPDDEMPTRPVPSVRVTAIGTCSIAVPNLVDTSRAPVQRSEAALAETGLTFHSLTIRPTASGLPHEQPPRRVAELDRTTPATGVSDPVVSDPSLVVVVMQWETRERTNRAAWPVAGFATRFPQREVADGPIRRS